ncbi:tetratricopeptide repeat protein [Chryseobacterium sp. SIMBA_028]|uniref:tetratricopeptide repeat protein n=1 Tax=Chryseobacterium sp. SIMBA_028 TaxID=3085771 RepID=UPI00397BE0BB
MKKDLNAIHRIERLTQQYFNEGEIRSGLKTYRSLLEDYPKDRNYYLNYINFLLDESVIAELLWPAYDEAVACCDRAIAQLSEEEKLFFYVKKAEVYVIMMDGDHQWYMDHQTEANHFIETAVERYPTNVPLLKSAMAFYRMNGNQNKFDEILDKVYQIIPHDFMIVLEKVTNLEQRGNIEEGIDILEKWININPESSYLSTSYNKIILMCKKVDNQDMADVYQDLLDNQ